jgi:hypothetical protein
MLKPLGALERLGGRSWVLGQPWGGHDVADKISEGP